MLAATLAMALWELGQTKAAAGLLADRLDVLVAECRPDVVATG
jgi:hypothetical protein